MLCQIPQISSNTCKILLDQFGSIHEIFEQKRENWPPKEPGRRECGDKPEGGFVFDGADPRDEKFILHIITRQQEVPSLGTSYRSLERFKFFFDSRYNFEDLVRYRFSPQEEALDSPYMAYYGYTGRLNKTSMAGNQVILIQIP